MIHFNKAQNFNILFPHNWTDRGELYVRN